MIRSSVLLALLAGLAWWLHGEQSRGRFREVDEMFLDFLIANNREELKPDPAMLDRVVLATMRETEKGEYSTWPPAPIDYQMIFKGIAAHDPEVLVIAEPLSWPSPKPELIPQVAQSLLPLPSVIIAAGAKTGETAVVSSSFVRERLPVLKHVRGEQGVLPWLQSVDREPEQEFARQSDVGVVVTDKHYAALRVAEGCVPSLETQTLAHAARMPFNNQRLTIGPGAGLHLGDEWFIPLENDGSFRGSKVEVPEVNALDVLTATVTDVDAALTKALGKGKIVVLGMADESTRQRAHAIAEALALPRVRVLPFVGQVAAWVVAALLAVWLLWIPKASALMRALLLLIVALTASYLAFQSTKVWCPPAIPAALIAAGGVFARLFGKKALCASSP